MHRRLRRSAPRRRPACAARQILVTKAPASGSSSWPATLPTPEQQPTPAGGLAAPRPRPLSVSEESAKVPLSANGGGRRRGPPQKRC